MENIAMIMDIEKFKKVIKSKKLSDKFSSQDFIKVYRDMFEEDYTKNISVGKGSFRKLHGPMASYLRRKDEELGIRKVDEKPNENVKGNMTRCALWEKVKKD